MGFAEIAIAAIAGLLVFLNLMHGETTLETTKATKVEVQTHVSQHCPEGPRQKCPEDGNARRDPPLNPDGMLSPAPGNPDP